MPHPRRRLARGRAVQEETIVPCAHWRSGFDIRCPPGGKDCERMSNPKLHQNAIFCSGPLIPTFAKECAELGCECWNRTTSQGFHGHFTAILLANCAP